MAREEMLFSWRIAGNHFRQAGSPAARVSSSAAGFRSKVQSAAVVNKDSAVSDARPYQIPSHSMHREIRTYAELQQHMRDALREQHPEWIEANGECSACQLYESRFAEQLELFAKKPPIRPSDTLESGLRIRPPRDPSS